MAVSVVSKVPHGTRLVRESVTTQGLSALHLAVVYNRLEAAQLLLHCGADIDSRHVRLMAIGRSKVRHMFIFGKISVHYC